MTQAKLHNPSKAKSCRRENSALPPFGLAVIRANHQPAANVRRTARTENAVHARQICGSTSDIFSPPARRLPGAGRFGVEASAPLRHVDPASDTSHRSSVRKVDESAVNVSQSAGGASSLKTLASIVFGPVRRNCDTSIFEICFQFRVEAV